MSADRGSSLTSVAARSAQMRLNPCMVGIWRQILSIYDCFPMGCFTSEISSHMVEKPLRCSVICGLSTLQTARTPLSIRNQQTAPAPPHVVRICRLYEEPPLHIESELRQQ